MTWLYYLLEGNFYLVVFYGFYKTFLHRETFYTINRYYLIAATLCSFVIPVFKIGYLNNIFETETTNAVLQQKEILPATNHFELSTALLYAYLITTAYFLARMLYSLISMLAIYYRSKRSKVKKVTYVELEGSHTAFSFFNILFINPELDHRNTILKHEMVHIKQHHSIDIIFFELIQILCWFNPVSYLLKQDIKLLHEYIADDITTEADIQKHEYALFLIQNSFGVIPNKLSNQIFNHSLIKRRIKMLNQEKSGGLTRFRLLLLLPLTVGLLCISTMAFSKDYAVIDLFPEKVVPQLPHQDTIKKVKRIKPTHLLPAPPPPATPKKIRFPLPKHLKSSTDPVPPTTPLEPKSHQVPPPPPVEPQQTPPPPPPTEPISPSKNITPEVSSVSGKKTMKFYLDNNMKMIGNPTIYDTPVKF